MFFYTRYRRELGAARRRVQLSGSSITETTLGAIEQVTPWPTGVQLICP